MRLTQIHSHKRKPRILLSRRDQELSLSAAGVQYDRTRVQASQDLPEMTMADAGRQVNQLEEPVLKTDPVGGTGHPAREIMMRDNFHERRVIIFLGQGILRFALIILFDMVNLL